MIFVVKYIIAALCAGMANTEACGKSCHSSKPREWFFRVGSHIFARLDIIPITSFRCFLLFNLLVKNMRNCWTHYLIKFVKLCRRVPFNEKKILCNATVLDISAKPMPLCSSSSTPSNKQNSFFLATLFVELMYLWISFILPSAPHRSCYHHEPAEEWILNNIA